MKSLFIKSYIPNAHKLSINLGSSIDCYENNDSIYVLVNSMVNGPITEELKDWIKLKLDSAAEDQLLNLLARLKDDGAQVSARAPGPEDSFIYWFKMLFKTKSAWLPQAPGSEKKPR